MFARQRSYTAQRLEKMKKEKKATAKVKKVFWRDPKPLNGKLIYFTC